jgi:hypothetical protein
MHYFDLPHASVLLLAATLSHGAVAASDPNPQTHRVLRAATKRSDLSRRGLRVSKKFESELAYIQGMFYSFSLEHINTDLEIEENGWNGRSTFASQVMVKSKKPIMNLEEIEHMLQDVQCEDGQIKLSFVDTSSARDAYSSCKEENGGLMITSHDGCNKEGERAVYR